MATIILPDSIYNVARRLAYECDKAVDEYIADLISGVKQTPKAPRAKAELMAAMRERRRREKYGEDYQSRLCAWCSGEMRSHALPQAKYCTTRCRQAAYRAR